MWMEQLEEGVRGPERQEDTTRSVKETIHKMFVQPAMLNGMETVPVTNLQMKKLELTEMNMCRLAHFFLERNDNIRRD